MLIGFTGFATSGKDTGADFVVKELDAQRFAFAKALRDLALFMDPYFKEAGCTYSELLKEEGYEAAKKRPYVRRYLINLGEGVRRHIGPETWMDVVRKGLRSAKETRSHAVVTDVRYENEAVLVREMGGVVVKIVRPGVNAVSPEEEASISKIVPDYVVENSTTIDEFAEKVLTLVRKLIKDNNQ